MMEMIFPLFFVPILICLFIGQEWTTAEFLALRSSYNCSPLYGQYTMIWHIPDIKNYVLYAKWFVKLFSIDTKLESH